MPSWEEMCQQIVVAGRPGDVTSAALGWEQLLKNLNSVKESLETNVTDLGEVWKGPAYESFKTHIKQIATDTGRVVDDAEKHNGIVQSLKTAADKLSAAQADFPIPASCVNDVLEARNGRHRDRHGPLRDEGQARLPGPARPAHLARRLAQRQVRRGGQGLQPGQRRLRDHRLGHARAEHADRRPGAGRADPGPRRWPRRGQHRRRTQYGRDALAPVACRAAACRRSAGPVCPRPGAPGSAPPPTPA